MGLKAYDLVWLEGKSAAWRYPSEIEELSSFAPAVEEQPFDRFYKKPSPADPAAATATTTAIPVVVQVESPSQRSSQPSSPIVYGQTHHLCHDAGRKRPPRIYHEELPPREPASREPSAETRPGLIAQRPREPREPIVRELNPAYARAAIEDHSAQPAAGQTTLVDYLPRPGSRKTKTLTRFIAIVSASSPFWRPAFSSAFPSIKILWVFNIKWWPMRPPRRPLWGYRLQRHLTGHPQTQYSKPISCDDRSPHSAAAAGARCHHSIRFRRVMKIPS